MNQQAFMTLKQVVIREQNKLSTKLGKVTYSKTKRQHILMLGKFVLLKIANIRNLIMDMLDLVTMDWEEQT